MTKAAWNVMGREFGRLVVTGLRGTEGRDKYWAVCKCDCGKTKEIYVYSLLHGDTRSCGCLNAELVKTRCLGEQHHINLAGKRFGRLVVLRRAGVNSSRSAIWECRCDCGTLTKTTAGSLMNAGTKSCGCLQREAVIRTMTKHGMYQSATYGIWEGVIARCKNPNNHAYRYYGGRGITVCDRWESFENFLTDMGERPGRKTIDRIDTNGNYEPGNCRWATMKEQRRNCRNTVFYEYNGQKKILPDWAEEFGVNMGTVRSRLRRGWAFDRALTQEVY